MTPRILVVGGAGSFGRRLVERLLSRTQAAVVVAGRSLPRAQAVVERLRADYPGRDVAAAAIDKNHAGAEMLRALEVTHVIDAAGPFQGSALTLARAAIAARCTYLDLADSRDFAQRFAALDAEAREAGVLALTGASSTPALSRAILDALTAGWQAVERVEIAISPGNRAPRGPSLVETIFSFVGRPVAVLIGGRWQKRTGWGDLARISMPGLGPRWLSLCESPDLDQVPQRFPKVRTAIFRAGLELSVLHLCLSMLSRLVRVGLLRNPRPLAPGLLRVADLLRNFGSDRGGMIVDVEGHDAHGRRIRALWSLTAESGDGPVIPVLPAVALLRELLSHAPVQVGARSAAGWLSLGAIEAEFAPFAIATRRATQYLEGGSLLERALGEDHAHLPQALREAHDPRPAIRLHGEAQVDGAVHAAGRLVARCFGLPGSGTTAADVVIRREGAGETWTRQFGRTAFTSHLELGSQPGRIAERFGPFRFDLEIRAIDRGFSLTVASWRIGALSLPRRLAPRSDARAVIDGEGRYTFDVPIDLPLFGRLVHYRGWLRPMSPERQPSEHAMALSSLPRPS